MNFTETTEERRRVRELCQKHLPSLSAFKFPSGPSFAIFANEEPMTGDLRHLTTTATCIESLRDCHATCISKSALVNIANTVGIEEQEFSKLTAAQAMQLLISSLVTSYYAGATKRPLEDWVSEKSAPIYCIARSMPLFLDGTTNWTAKHSELISTVCQQLLKNSEGFGIGEQKMEDGKPLLEWYPANAYHTYWALRVLTKLRDAPPVGMPVPAQMLGLDMARTVSGLRLWARNKLGEEVGLHWGQSVTLDSDQLTWALTTFIEFGDDASSNLRDQDLIRKAFEALGSTQEHGSWRHYKPLFVYSNVGNAYCYVYESFTYLLKAVLAKLPKQEFLEEVIRAFVDRLRRLREYTELTQVQAGTDGAVIAWSSGHRPGDTKAEGWATASVFSYLQAYRRVLGVLARRDALDALPRSALSRDPKALQTLIERGDTWSSKTTVAEDLITFFINPVLMQADPNPSEPDDQPIEEWQARSAILFGPPGASKTTIARLMAAALRWKYIELHSSHFVAEGIQSVQSTADRIFKQLMELDHAVVLFDEPDELVRERHDSPDAFGRFLTTSMLPKLAELWKQRRVIYFIATNHISYFDAAIVRSERFDVLALTLPPSFDRKKAALQDRLQSLTGRPVSISVTREDVEERVKAVDAAIRKRRKISPEATLTKKDQLVKFVLLRWDQIDELAFHIQQIASKKDTMIVNPQCLSDALQRIVDHRLGLLATYGDYFRDSKQARRDFQRKPVFEVRNLPNGEPLPPSTVRVGGRVWYKCESGVCPKRLGSYSVIRTSTPGVLEVKKKRS